MVLNCMTKTQRSSIRIFYEACHASEITPEWGPTLISAICEFLDLRYLAASTLCSHWNLLTTLAERRHQVITPQQEAEFNMVLARCKPSVDNKMPVSKTLLNEFCAAADQVFQEYDATLMKAILLTAWGGFMCISEYTEAEKDAKTTISRLTA